MSNTTTPEVATPAYRSGLFFNGLEGAETKSKQRNSLTLGAITLLHASIAWPETTYEDMMDHMRNNAHAILKRNGSLLQVGASAGGSPAVALHSELLETHPEATILTICLSPWLQLSDEDDLRLLEETTRQFHPNNEVISACVDSVVACNEMIIPDLSEAAKRRLAIVIPTDDEVVPTRLMGIEGVQEYTVASTTHVSGVINGLRLLPEAYEKQLASLG